MDHITSLLNNPQFTALVNAQVFAAVLLALLVYRLVAPIIDFFNPFFMLLRVMDAAKKALPLNSGATGAVCYSSSNGGASK